MIVVRHDLQNGQRVSYRKGCEVIISHDNGLTWDLSRRYILDECSRPHGVPSSVETITAGCRHNVNGLSYFKCFASNMESQFKAGKHDTDSAIKTER